MSHTYINFVYHIVFATKEREPFLNQEIRPQLFTFFENLLQDRGHLLLLANGVSDHVHLLARIRQDVVFSEVIRDLKAFSSGWIHKTFPQQEPFAWQRGYGAFTVGESQIERVARFIANQEIHHQNKTFETEYVQMLRAHRIKFDERCVWG